jgi:hypothetical protein
MDPHGALYVADGPKRTIMRLYQGLTTNIPLLPIEACGHKTSVTDDLNQP